MEWTYVVTVVSGGRVNVTVNSFLFTIRGSKYHRVFPFKHLWWILFKGLSLWREIPCIVYSCAYLRWKRKHKRIDWHIIACASLNDWNYSKNKILLSHVVVRYHHWNKGYFACRKLIYLYLKDKFRSQILKPEKSEVNFLTSVYLGKIMLNFRNFDRKHFV